MRALSLKQPWAWLVIRPDVVDVKARRALRQTTEIKSIENRVWNTTFRGWFLVHASKSMTNDEYDAAWQTARAISPELARRMPPPRKIDLGGIVGAAELWDVVAPTSVPHVQWQFHWHARDQYGFCLRYQQPLPFFPCKGMQRWFGNFGVRDGKVVEL